MFNKAILNDVSHCLCWLFPGRMKIRYWTSSRLPCLLDLHLEERHLSNKKHKTEQLIDMQPQRIVQESSEMLPEMASSLTHVWLFTSLAKEVSFDSWNVNCEFNECNLFFPTWIYFQEFLTRNHKYSCLTCFVCHLNNCNHILVVMLPHNCKESISPIQYCDSNYSTSSTAW